MHHVEDNMPDDLSSTLRYRRDSFLHFLAYFARFFFLAIVELPLYLMRKRRRDDGEEGGDRRALPLGRHRRAPSASTGASGSSPSPSRSSPCAS